MKVRYLGDSDPLILLHGKIYEVLSISKTGGWYRIIDEEGIDEDEELQGYLYPPELFEIVEESKVEFEK